MDEADDLGAMLLDRSFDLFRSEDLSVGRSIFMTSAPQRAATSAMRPPNTPLTPTRTRSPGSTRLTTQVSHPRTACPTDRHGEFVGV